MQIQTRRLQKVGLLATRQEAEFVSGVLDAADLPHAIVDVGQGLELRVDPDDAGRVAELIERLDVHQTAREGTRQRRGEAAGRRVLLIGVGSLIAGVGGLIATGLIPMPSSISSVSLGLMLGLAGVALVVVGVLGLVKRRG